MAHTRTLFNLTNRPLVIVLDHPAFLRPKYGWKRVALQVQDEQPDGSRHARIIGQSIPGSITVPPKGKAQGLHPAIVHCAQVRSFLRAEPPVVRVENDDPKIKPKATRRRRGRGSRGSKG